MGIFRGWFSGFKPPNDIRSCCKNLNCIKNMLKNNGTPNYNTPKNPFYGYIPAERLKFCPCKNMEIRQLCMNNLTTEFLFILMDRFSYAIFSLLQQNTVGSFIKIPRPLSRCHEKEYPQTSISNGILYFYPHLSPNS